MPKGNPGAKAWGMSAKGAVQGRLLAQSLEPGTLDLRAVGLSPRLGVESL